MIAQKAIRSNLIPMISTKLIHTGKTSADFNCFGGVNAHHCSRQVSIELTDEARQWLADKGYDQRFGARPLSRVIQEHIKKPLAEELLFGRLANGGHLIIRAEDDRLVHEVNEEEEIL